MQKKAVRVFAPATIANVSCGFDVMGMALEKPVDEIIIRKSHRAGVHIYKIHGADLPLDPNQNVVGVALESLLSQLPDFSEGFEIEIFKNIDPGSGIGSSAASAAGAVMGANVLLNNPFTSFELVRFAMEGERIASGSAHADNVAPAIMGGFTLIRSYGPLHLVSLHTPKELWATVLHPKIEIKTSEAREILKKKVLMSDAIRQWGNVGALVAGLYQEDYDLIGSSLEDFIVEPIRSILIPAFQELKIKCKASGALGGGISGSGPSVFMLSKGREKAEMVALCMERVYTNLGLDYNIYVSQVNQQGIRWEFID